MKLETRSSRTRRRASFARYVCSVEATHDDGRRLTSFLTIRPQFKKGDIFFNYGCFPQTWEDPTFIHPDAEGCRGDNDPLDVCEIGARIIPSGVSTAVEYSLNSPQARIL